MTEKRRRALAMGIACLLALIMLFSVFFIILESDHECSGEDCAICAVLSVCETILRHLLPVTAPLLPTAIAAAAVSGLRRIHPRLLDTVTLITLKVKLSN